MSNSLCIFPKDVTTEFLRPVFDLICENSLFIGLDSDSIDDDYYLDTLEDIIKDVETVIFLGHGSSTTLYGSNLNPMFCQENDNISLLERKKLLLFSCRSTDFLKNYKLHSSIGFGFIPTSLDDARDGVKLHKIDISNLDSLDIEAFKTSIVNIWKRTIIDVRLSSINRFMSLFVFYTNVEIVDILINHKDLPHNTIVADMLYYLKEDMVYF